jgi:hypothetical protein
MPTLDIPIVERAYEAGPFPRVARWVDEHQALASVLMVLAVFGLFVLGAWLDGGAS